VCHSVYLSFVLCSSIIAAKQRLVKLAD
jgi:hypothetical protein